MGQCTSKHGVRREGANSNDLNDDKRNLAVKQQSSCNPEDKNVHSLSSNVNQSQNRNTFLGTQSALSSAEENNYSSDFCEEEEESFTTADSSSRSMRYPQNRKDSSGLSRKTSSVTPSSISPDKAPSTSTSYFSPSDSKDENNVGSSVSIHDVLKKPGCEMFVIDFEDDVTSLTSPKKRVPFSCMYNKKPILQPSSTSNSPKKNPKLNIRNDKVSDVKNASLDASHGISKRSPSNNKRPKINKYNDINTNKRNNSGSDYQCHDKNKLGPVNNKNQSLSPKEHSPLKDIISNKKLKKDIVNQKIKSQGSPKHTFLKKKSKNNKPENVQQNDGKLMKCIYLKKSHIIKKHKY